ncbi:MAG TPA: hypothetical protein VES39_05795 [Rhodospirillales bacterium]|nr:hypothetical protein [Rhodospirillales bacterium]
MRGRCAGSPAGTHGRTACRCSRRTAIERLLQFLDHLDDLLAPALRPDQHRIEEFFRFVPPVAYVPVTGAGSPAGLRESQFLAAFSGGAAVRLAAGSAAFLLQRSFPFAAVDLTRTPFLQMYELAENADAVAAGASGQRYRLYVERGLNGPAADDDVTGAFEDAWEVYRGLIRRRVFLPLAATPEAVAAQIGIVEAVRDVMQVANRQAARAAASSLDERGALAALAALHAVQKDLVTLFLSAIPGIADTQSREVFARRVENLLDRTLDDGTPGLKPALDAGGLHQAVAAQNAINRFVGAWSGEGVAVGPITVTFLASPDGGNAVPGGAAMPHLFQLVNGTDRRLTFALEAIATAPSGSWQGAARIFATSGAEIADIAVPSAGQVTLEVQVAAPSGAQEGETATLTLLVRLGPPNDRSGSAVLSLPVAADQGVPVTRSVSFVGNALTPSGGPLVVAQPFATQTYGFNVRYDAQQGPAAADFDVTVTLTQPTAGSFGDWAVGIQEPEAAPTDGNGNHTRRLQLASGETMQLSVFIVKLMPGAATTSFTVRIASVHLNPAIEAQRQESFTLQIA